MGNIGFEFFDDGGEDRVREAVQGSPLGVAEVRFDVPDVFCGEGAEGGEGGVRGGGEWVEAR